MNKIGFLKVSLSLIAGALLSVGASATVIVNGSFEDGDFSGANYSWLTVANGQSNITGWTIGGAAVDWHNGAEFNPIQDGLKAVDLNLSGGGLGNTGTLSQTFSTSIDTTYDLAFYFAGPKASFPDPRQVKVDVAGISQVFDQVASPNKDLNWGLHTLSFTAIDVATTLEFSAVNGSGYWGALIDNVSVTAQVAEPSSIALLVIGLLGLGFTRRKANARYIA